MLNFFTRYFFPKEIVIKKGSLQRLKFLNISSPLVVYSSSAEENGSIEKIKNFFPDISLMKIDSGEPKLSSIECYQDISKNDAIIAIGGGSVIDSAKLLIARFLSEDSISSLKPFALKDENKNKPFFIAIPTTVGSGAESDGVAVFESENRKTPLISDLLVPDLAILDSSLVADLPRTILTTTALDAFTHGFESYFSRMTNDFSKILSVTSCTTIIDSLNNIDNNPQMIERLLYASYLAGLAQSVTSVGLIHAISHVISPKVKIGHGHINSLLISPVMKFYQRKDLDINSFIRNIGYDNIKELDIFLKKTLKTNEIKMIDRKTIVIDEALISDIKNDICFKTSPILPNDEEIIKILETIIE
jgi:alcohol dehydrogenase class IV